MSTPRMTRTRTGIAGTLARAPRTHALRPFALLVVLVLAALATVVGSKTFNSPVAVAVSSPEAGATDRSVENPVDTHRGDPAFPGVQPTVMVHVAGSVHVPGLVELPIGARVADAITAAGGPLAGVELDSVNLARKVSDGEQLLVGVIPPPHTGDDSPDGTEGSTGGATVAQADPQSRVNLNTATADQLEQLPRVGPATAAKILEHRQRNGPFTSVDQLLDVSGIGERTLAGLRDLVQV